MKSNSVMTFAYDAPSRTLSWLFSDAGTAQFTIPGDVPEGNNGAAMVHGYKQKIADAAAISRNAETGLPATVADKRAAMAAVIDTLNGGAWNAERTGGSGNVGGLLAAAIAEVNGTDVVKVREYLKTRTKAQRDAIAANKKFAGTLAKLQKARVANVDITDDLAELDNL